MKLLLDSCVWGGAVARLRAAGHDVVWSGDWPADPGDEEILAHALAEGRVLVTLDKDFGELENHPPRAATRRHPPPFAARSRSSRAVPVPSAAPAAPSTASARSLSEGNRRARALRTFRVDGHDVEMFQHLKIGVKDSVYETWRTYFTWDAERRRILIGHCGPHLDLR